MAPEAPLIPTMIGGSARMISNVTVLRVDRNRADRRGARYVFACALKRASSIAAGGFIVAQTISRARRGYCVISDLKCPAAALGGLSSGIVRDIVRRWLAARRDHEAVGLSGLDIKAIAGAAGWQAMAPDADRRRPGRDLEHGMIPGATCRYTTGRLQALQPALPLISTLAAAAR